MHGMAKMLFAEEHPWKQIFSQIGNLDDLHIEFAIVEALRCISDTFARFLGPFHQSAINCQLTFINRLYSSDNALQLLHSLLIRGEQELSKIDMRLHNIKLTYGYSLHDQGRHTEAITILEEVLVHAQGHNQIDILDWLSYLHHKTGHNYEAESVLQEAIKKSEFRYGKFNSTVLRLKTRLESWLHEWGRGVEAAELNAEILDILGPDDVELQDISLVNL